MFTTHAGKILGYALAFFIVMMGIGGCAAILIFVGGIEFATMILFGIAVVACFTGFGWFLYMIS